MKSLRDEVARHTFREDLMYRIRVVPIFLPSLAEREGDVEALTWHYVAELGKHYGRVFTGIERRAHEALMDYPWPGNVRELRNVIEHAYVVGEGSTLRFQHLTPELKGEPPPGASPGALTLTHRRRLQREALIEALDSTGWRKELAAEKLGISRSTLWRRLREHGLSELQHARLGSHDLADSRYGSA